MRIEQARKLKKGQIVFVPRDGIRPPCRVTVDSDDCATTGESKTLKLTPYIWVEVSHFAPRRRVKEVWPSNLLKLPEY